MKTTIVSVYTDLLYNDLFSIAVLFVVVDLRIRAANKWYCIPACVWLNGETTIYLVAACG